MCNKCNKYISKEEYLQKIEEYLKNVCENVWICGTCERGYIKTKNLKINLHNLGENNENQVL